MQTTGWTILRTKVSVITWQRCLIDIGLLSSKVTSTTGTFQNHCHDLSREVEMTQELGPGHWGLDSALPESTLSVVRSPSLVSWDQVFTNCWVIIKCFLLIHGFEDELCPHSYLFKCDHSLLGSTWWLVLLNTSYFLHNIF